MWPTWPSPSIRPRIAVGGGLTASADVLLPALRRRLAQAVPFPPELVTARFDQDGALRVRSRLRWTTPLTGLDGP